MANLFTHYNLLLITMWHLVLWYSIVNQETAIRTVIAVNTSHQKYIFLPMNSFHAAQTSYQYILNISTNFSFNNTTVNSANK